MGIRIAVLASGRGSNLLAIMDSIAAGKVDGEIAVVLSDKAEAKALEHAKQAGIPAYHVNPKAYAQKAEYEAELLKLIEKADCQLICLAGYMRILSPYFISNAPCPVMNIHPALLPSFPGLHGQRQALEYGVKVAGCTVHFVDEGADTGPIIMQKTVEVKQDDDAKKLAERVLEVEHEILTKSISMFCENKLTVNGRRVYIND